MQMFEQIGEFKPDSLIAGNGFPILKEGIGLKAGQGILKRGSLIMRGSDRAGHIAGSVVKVKAGEGESATGIDMEMEVCGILADDTDTGDDVSAANIPATVYQSGEFNREAVLVRGEGTKVGSYEHEMRCAGIYLRSVQAYE